MSVANNRMWLRNKKSDDKVLIAKYYPSTGWYPFHNDLVERIAQLFKANEEAPTMWGDNDWEITFEMTRAGD